jgi:WD40 repeat protein
MSGSGDKVRVHPQCCYGADMGYGDGAHSMLMEPEDVSGFFFGGGVLIVFVLHMHIVNMGMTSVTISPPGLWLVTGGSLDTIRWLWSCR